jgi:hypothetical protein
VSPTASCIKQSIKTNFIQQIPIKTSHFDLKLHPNVNNAIDSSSALSEANASLPQT